jgi:hypothetical protein
MKDENNILQGIKENDGGGKFNYYNIVRTCVIVTMYPQYNNNMIIIKIAFCRSYKNSSMLPGFLLNKQMQYYCALRPVTFRESVFKNKAAVCPVHLLFWSQL